MPNRNSSNRSIQPLPTMASNIRTEAVSRSQGSRSLVPQDSKTEALSADIDFRIQQLQAKRKTVNLNSVDDMRQKTIDYLKACSAAGTVPTMQGLCVHGYGYSRQHCYRQMANRAGSPESVFFETVSDMFSDILSNESLQGNVNAIMSIFLLKNNHGFSDSYQIGPINNPSREKSIDELIAEAQMLSAEPDDDPDCPDGYIPVPDGWEDIP